MIDLQPPEKSSPPMPARPKKQGMNVFKSMLKKKSSEPSSAPEDQYSEPDVVEELVEEGSANLSERSVILSSASRLDEKITASTLVLKIMISTLFTCFLMFGCFTSEMMTVCDRITYVRMTFVLPLLFDATL